MVKLEPDLKLCVVLISVLEISLNLVVKVCELIRGLLQVRIESNQIPYSLVEGIKMKPSFSVFGEFQTHSLQIKIGSRESAVLRLDCTWWLRFLYSLLGYIILNN